MRKSYYFDNMNIFICDNICENTAYIYLIYKK